MHKASLATPDDVTACHAILRRGSKSFALAARCMPARLRDPVAVVYAFCREADDAVDHASHVGPALAGLHRRLDAIYSGMGCSHAVDRALSSVVDRWHLPRVCFAALLEGFAWDATGRQYQSFSEVCDYAARVASSVGALMTLLMGTRDPAVLARACDLGVAMQLSNIARDVGEDARAGRLYLPRQWLSEAGIDADAFLARPRFTAELGHVVARLVHESTALYSRAEQGIGHLPADCRMGIYAARLIYADIGRRVGSRLSYNSVDQRAVVPTWRKLWLLARSSTARLWRPHALAGDCLGETAYLVRAVRGEACS